MDDMPIFTDEGQICQFSRSKKRKGYSRETIIKNKIPDRKSTTKEIEIYTFVLLHWKSRTRIKRQNLFEIECELPVSIVTPHKAQTVFSSRQRTLNRS